MLSPDRDLDKTRQHGSGHEASDVGEVEIFRNHGLGLANPAHEHARHHADPQRGDSPDDQHLLGVSHVRLPSCSVEPE